MTSKKQANFYFDVISPFSYIYVKQCSSLAEQLDIQPIPIFLGGLLRSLNSKGPAEIPPKRIHTYQYCTWLAQSLRLPFRFPETHPFPSVSAQRLLVQSRADWKMVERALEFVWQHGRDPNSSWSDFCIYLGLPAQTAIPSDVAVKSALIANTENAIAEGVFGVPALTLDGHCFWGVDTIPWTLDYLKDPNMFHHDSYRHAANIPFGI